MVGKKIRLNRTKRGFTQSELGRRIGLSVTYISLIENGIKPVPTELIPSFARELQMSIEELTGSYDEIQLTKVRELLDEAYDLNVREKIDESKEKLEIIENEYTIYLEKEDIKIEYLLLNILNERLSENARKIFNEINEATVQKYPLLHLRYMRIVANYHYIDGNIYKAITKLKQATKMISNTQYEKSLDIALIHADLGYYFLRTEYYSLTFLHIQMCIQFFVDNNYYNILYRIYSNRGIVYWKLGFFEKALEQYEKSLNLLKSYSCELSYAPIYLNMALLYFENEDHDKAFHYFNRSLTIAKKYGNENYIYPLYNMTNAYFLKGDYDQFHKNIAELMEIFKETSNPFLLGKTYELLGDYYFKMCDEKYIDNYKKAIEIFKQVRKDVVAAQICYRMGKELNDLDLLAEAAELYHGYINRDDWV